MLYADFTSSSARVICVNPPGRSKYLFLLNLMLPLKSSILQRGPDGLPKRSELRWVDQQSEEIASEVQAAKPLSSTLVFRQDCPSLAIREPDKYDLYEGGLSPASLAGKAPNIGATPETTATAEVSSPDSPIVVARFMRHPLGARMQPIPHRISPTAPPTPTKTRSIHGGSVLFEKTSEMILSSRFVSSGQTTSSSAMSMTIASTTTTTKTTATSASIVQQLSKRQTNKETQKQTNTQTNTPTDSHTHKTIMYERTKKKSK